VGTLLLTILRIASTAGTLCPANQEETSRDDRAETDLRPASASDLPADMESR
jgi:hypothetical protein